MEHHFRILNTSVTEVLRYGVLLLAVYIRVHRLIEISKNYYLSL